LDQRPSVKKSGPTDSQIGRTRIQEPRYTPTPDADARVVPSAGSPRPWPWLPGRHSHPRMRSRSAPDAARDVISEAGTAPQSDRQEIAVVHASCRTDMSRDPSRGVPGELSRRQSPPRCGPTHGLGEGTGGCPPRVGLAARGRPARRLRPWLSPRLDAGHRHAKPTPRRGVGAWELFQALGHGRDSDRSRHPQVERQAHQLVPEVVGPGNAESRDGPDRGRDFRPGRATEPASPAWPLHMRVRSAPAPDAVRERRIGRKDRAAA